MSREEVRSLVVPGATFQQWWGPDNLNNKVVHIRAIVDEEQVVHMEWWRKWGGHWHYNVQHITWYEGVAHDGNLYVLPPSAAAPEREEDDDHTEGEDA